MSSFEEKLKTYFKLSEEAFSMRKKAPSFSLLPDISSFSCVKKAIERLEEAKKKGEKILIYGDYDFDGIAATSIIYKTLLQKGIDCRYYVPSRYIDGYGLNEENVVSIAEAGYKIIFTVDNGVKATEAINKAHELGLEVIVLDHHDYEEEPPFIVTLIHPNTVSLSSPTVSAGYLSYLFLRAYLGKDDPYLFIIGATSLLSDAMPLRDYNLSSAKLAVNLINETKPLQFTLLSNKSVFYGSTLQMEVIPKINAVGRLEQKHETNRVVRYFVSDDEKEIRQLAVYLNEVNERRKSLTKLAAEKIKIDEKEDAIFLLTDLPEGLNGLLSSRLLAEHNKPVAVFSPSSKDDSVYIGSLRSKKGFSVLKALEETSAPLLGHGGHEFAGGISLKKEDLETFENDFKRMAKEHPIEKDEKTSIALEEDECLYSSFLLLQEMGPFGNENEEPTFSLKMPVSSLHFIKDGKYLSTSLSTGARLFSFSLGASSFPKEGEVILTFKMSENEWKGRKSLDLFVEREEESV